MNENQKKLMSIIENFSEKELEQVLVFVEFLKYKSEKETEQMMNKSIEKNIEALKELAKYN